MSLLCSSRVLRDLWPSVAASDCVFKLDGKRRRLSLSQKKKGGSCWKVSKGVFTRDREGKTWIHPRQHQTLKQSKDTARTEQGHNSRRGYMSKYTPRTEQEHSSFLKTIKTISNKLFAGCFFARYDIIFESRLICHISYLNAILKVAVYRQCTYFNVLQ